MRSFLRGIVVFVGLVAGISGAYMMQKTLFPALIPQAIPAVSSTNALQSISIGGTVQSFDGKLLVLAITSPFERATTDFLSIGVSTSTAVRILQPHFSDTGIIVFWKEILGDSSALSRGVNLRASMPRTQGPLRASTLTIYLPS